MNMEKFAGQAMEMEVLDLVAGGDDRDFMKALLNRKEVDWRGVESLYKAAGISVKYTKSIRRNRINCEFRRNGKVISHLDARIFMARYVGKPNFDVTKYDFPRTDSWF